MAVEFICCGHSLTLLVLVTYLEDRCSSLGWKQAGCCLLAYECSRPRHLPGAQPATICITHYCNFGRERTTKLRGLVFSLSCQLCFPSSLSLYIFSLLPKFQACQIFFYQFLPLWLFPFCPSKNMFFSFKLPRLTFFISISSPLCLSRLWRSSWVRCVAGSSLTVLGSSPNLQLLSFSWPASLTSPEPLTSSKHTRYSSTSIGDTTEMTTAFFFPPQDTTGLN